MSVEEDTEFRDLIIQKTLTPNGCLAKIRAQLRASIFLALSEDEMLQKEEPLLNKKVKSELQSEEGKIMFSLVREFLEFFDLHFTITVYEPESYLGSGYQYEGREKIIHELGIPQLDENTNVPILAQLIRIIQQNVSPGEELGDIKSCTSGTKKSSETSIAEEQNNKSYTTISEDFNSTEISEDNSYRLSGDFPKCVTEIKTIPKENKFNVTFNVSPVLRNDISSEEHNKSEVSQESVSEKKSVPKISTLENFSKSTDEDVRSSNSNKTKSSQKSDKIKPKNSLSSLADLPPLQLNKSRGNDTMLLPSLYKKEKSNLKELDKLLDLECDSMDNYEEDFMSGTEIDALNSTGFLMSDSTKINLLDVSNTTPSKILNDTYNKQIKSLETVHKPDLQKINLNGGENPSEEALNFTNLEKLDNGTNKNNFVKDKSSSIASSITSDDFELNSNLEDILHSSASN